MKKEIKSNQESLICYNTEYIDDTLKLVKDHNLIPSEYGINYMMFTCFKDALEKYIIDIVPYETNTSVLLKDTYNAIGHILEDIYKIAFVQGYSTSLSDEISSNRRQLLSSWEL